MRSLAAEARDRRNLLAGLFLVVALVFVVLLLRRQWTSLDEVVDGLRGFRWEFQPLWLVAAVLLAVGNLVLMASVWTRLFRRTGGTAPWWFGVRVWVVTNFGRYIPGKVWQLGGLAVYLKARGDSGAAALVSALTFQIISLVTGSAVAAATVGVRWAAGGGNVLPGAVILGLLLAVGLHPGTIRFAARRLGGLLGEEELAADLRGTDIATAAAGMLIAWAVYGAGFVCLLKGIGIAWPIADAGLLTGIFAASYVIGYLALVAPGGLVVREGAMTGLLAELGGLSVGVGALVAVLARVWLLAAELLALALVVMVPGQRDKGIGGS